ncbi:MAG TPA: hypothetical protein VN192_07435, partial [Flavobacterium sp.]|nr:hypothetical protein [Flavobacterium sp.]
ITLGDLMRKPGWIRMSIHPTTTNEEIQYICNSIIALAENHLDWAKDYIYDKNTNEFIHKNAKPFEKELVEEWFKL